MADRIKRRDGPVRGYAWLNAPTNMNYAMDVKSPRVDAPPFNQRKGGAGGKRAGKAY